MSQGALFSTRFTFGLAAFLLSAAAFALLTPLELCPSVILPGGGAPLHVKDGVVVFNSTSLWGRAHGEMKRVAASEILSPIPDPYLNSIARNGFGMTQLKPVNVKLGPIKFRVSRPERTEESRKEVVAWLKQRLRDAGLADDRFFLRREEVELDTRTDRELSRRKKNEKTVRLH